MGNDMSRGATPPGPSPTEINALGQAGLAGDALLTSLTGPAPDHLLLDRAAYAPHRLPDSATDIAVWIKQARRLTAMLQEAAMT
ncbi:MAG: hypothetical protein ACJ72M_07040 [Propionibacteriaceae bacterium]|jgi:hypothetical protein